MIAKSLRGRRVHEPDRVWFGRRSAWTEERHRRCSTADWMSAGLRGASDVGGLLCRIKRRTKSRRGQHCRPQPIEELLADPSRTRGLVLESVPELLTQVASRVASLKTLEGALLALMQASGSRTAAPETSAVRFWVRRNSPSFSAFQNRGSENRLASATCHPSNSGTTFASGLKKSSAFSPNAPAKPLDFLDHRLYDTYSHDWARTPFHQTEVGAYASCPCGSSRCNFEHRGALGARRDGDLRAGRETVGEARRGT